MDIATIENLFEVRASELFFYSPYSFLRRVNQKSLFENTVKIKFMDLMLGGKNVFEINIEGFSHIFIIQHLKWDSDYFKIQTYRLHTILYDHDNIKILGKDINEFTRSFFKRMGEYCFIEIPTEDIKLIQGLGLARFKLIETRMTYYLNNLNEFAYERFPVRKANISDIENLKRVAREMRNRYDRFHADNIFSNEISDEFLATFVEESIKGFADYVIVPNAKGVPPDAFLTAKYLKEDWSGIGANISKLVLSAVSSLTCKGWYIKLISEMIYHLRDVGTEYVFMHPSSTNKPIIHTYEKLGCKLGQVTLIFSFES